MRTDRRYRLNRGNATYWVLLLLVVAIGVALIVSLRVFGGDPADSRSETAKFVDEALHLDAVNDYEHIKNVGASKLEIMNIKTAWVMFETAYGRPPEDLEELVDSGYIEPGATTDAYQEAYRIVAEDGQIPQIQSSGTDRIFNTGDDVVGDLGGISPPFVPSPTPKPPPPPPKPKGTESPIESALRKRTEGSSKPTW